MLLRMKMMIVRVTVMGRMEISLENLSTNLQTL